MMQPEKEFEMFWEKERLEWPTSMAENPMLKDAVYAGWKKGATCHISAESHRSLMAKEISNKIYSIDGFSAALDAFYTTKNSDVVDVRAGVKAVIDHFLAVVDAHVYEQSNSLEVTIDKCDHGHSFAKIISSHPQKNGTPRCPHCMAIGLDKERLINEVALQTILDQIPNNDELLIRRIWDKVRLVYLSNGMSVAAPADTKRLDWMLDHMRKQLWHTVFFEYQHCKTLREAIDAAIEDAKHEDNHK